MICPKCGTDAGQSKFCPECGEKLIDLQPERPTSDDAQPDKAPTAEEANPNEAEEQPKEAESTESEPVGDETVKEGAADPSGEVQPEPGGSDASVEPPKKRNWKKTGLLVAAAVVLCVLLCVVWANRLKPNEKPAVTAVVSGIDKLPEKIALTDEQTVDSLEKSYDSLSPKQQRHVKNRKKLEKASAGIDSLKVEQAETAIAAIKTVTVDSGEAIQKAQELYDALPKELKDKVKTAAALEKAQQDYTSCRVEAVTQKIRQLGTITADSYDALKEIEEIYGDLSDDAKKLVTNYADCEQARKTCRAKLKEKFDIITAKLKKKYDSDSETAYYFCSTQPKYTNDRSYCLPFLAIPDEKWEKLMPVSGELGFYAVCLDDYGIYFKKVKISCKVNGETETYEQEFPYGKHVDRQVVSIGRHSWGSVKYGICEIAVLGNDYTYDEDSAEYIVNGMVLVMSMLKDLSQASTASITFYGDHDSKTVTIPKTDLEAMKPMQEAYSTYLAYCSLW